MRVRHNEERDRFEVELQGGLAVASYHRSGDTIAFTHTKVPPEHEGKGIGTKLIEAGLAYARQQGLKVTPVCPFFAHYMQKHSEVQDLLAQG